MADEKIKVLIVDDTAETRDSLKRMLQFDGLIEVVGTARSGKEAVEISQKIKPDVILMDINMPDMDGITATENIRRRLPYSQVIILSVQSDPDYMRRAMRAGAHDFLPKPPMIDELTSTIRRAGKVALQEKSKAEIESSVSVEIGSPSGAGRGAKGKIIVVYSPKGGAGCTTIATNLALALLNNDKKVVLVDGNMLYGDIPVFLKEQVRNTVLDLTSRVDELDSDVVREVMVKYSGTDLHILAAPLRSAFADQVSGDAFSKLLQYLRKVYAYVIVDTSTYLCDVTLSANQSADILVLVGTQEIPAIKKIHSFLTLLDEAGYPRDQVMFVMNKMDTRFGVAPEKAGQSLRQEVVLTIPFDEKFLVNDSINRGVPLIPNNKTHPVAKSIFALANLVKDKITKMEQTKEAEELNK